MKNPDIVTAIQPVAQSFEKLGIPYYIGGSVASSSYGIARSTMDIDVAAGLQTEHIQPLTDLLKPLYYIDRNMIFSAIKACSSFNIIHLHTMLKIDVFIAGNDAYEKELFKRRRRDKLDEDQNTPEFYVVSPEDIVLKKLVWFRMRGCVSGGQCNDVLGVLKVQKDYLDKKYLRHWASGLKVEDLLEKASIEAGIRF